MSPGRPSEYRQEIANAICQRLSDGDSLRAICRDEGMPSEATVRLWALDDREGFAAQYARAREIGYERLAEDILEIADDGANDTYVDGDGNVRTDQDVIGRSRLRVDTRKWMLSKMLPKRYGERQAIELNDVTPRSQAEIEARLAALLAKAGQKQEQ